MWELYNKYLWEKCSKMTFYNRIKKWLWISEAIKPVDRENWHSRWNIITKKYWVEMQWYYEQQCEKVNRNIFYQRLTRWYSKEEAIKIKFTPRPKKVPTKTNPWYIRKPKPIIQKKIDDTIIRYTKEESDIIKKEYEKMIEEKEYQIRGCDDPMEVKEINDMIEKLKNEYNTFCKISYEA